MVSAHSLRFARCLALATTLALPACSGETTGSPQLDTTTDSGTITDSATPPAPTADASSPLKDAGTTSNDAASSADAANTPDANVDVDSGGGGGGGAGPLYPPSFVG
jgi:hypothetical protein